MPVPSGKYGRFEYGGLPVSCSCFRVSELANQIKGCAGLKIRQMKE